jgi:hypothetical protein
MPHKAATKFESGLKDIIIQTITTNVECETDANGEPDWSDYMSLIDVLHTNIIAHAAPLVAAASATTVSGGSSTSSAPKTGKRSNNYTKWVRIAAKIRKNAINGDKQLTITSNFSNKGNSSATKYEEARESLDLEGKTMSLSETLDYLKENMPEKEKDLTITAICWGLMSKDFREEMVEELYCE